MTALDGRRQELLARLLAERRAAGTAERIPRRGATGTAPMSFAQQRLWFLNRVSPANPFYNVQAPVRHRGPFDTRALERADLDGSIARFVAQLAGEPVGEHHRDG